MVTFTDYSGIGFTDSEGGYQGIPWPKKGNVVIICKFGNTWSKLLDGEGVMPTGGQGCSLASPTVS